MLHEKEKLYMIFHYYPLFIIDKKLKKIKNNRKYIKKNILYFMISF